MTILTPIGQIQVNKRPKRIEVSRKKMFVLYLASMPFVAALFVFYTMRNDWIGLVSENIAAIILFSLVQTNLKLILRVRIRRRKSNE